MRGVPCSSGSVVSCTVPQPPNADHALTLGAHKTNRNLVIESPHEADEKDTRRFLVKRRTWRSRR